MSNLLNVVGSLIGLNQPEPPEGRKQITFPPFYFTLGTEVYYWDTTQLGNQKVSSIVAAWIDVSNLNLCTGAGIANQLVVAIGAPKNNVRPASNSVAYPNMVIRANNPLNAAGANGYPTDKTPQGFYIIPSQAPFSMQVSFSGSGTITPQPPPGNYAAIILYNYNPILTGYGIHPPAVHKIRQSNQATKG
jgi:hypothetical protein